MEYEKKLKGYPDDSDGSSGTDEEEEWGRRRKMLDETSDNGPDQRESNVVMQEAHALDKAMEDRIVARRSSASSMSSTGSGMGMGAVWRNRYALRKRTESIASNGTNRSFLSEHLVEEDEEQELLGVGGDFDHDVRLKQVDESSTTTSPDVEGESTSQTASIPTSLPAIRPSDWKASFTPPMTAMCSTFQLPTRPPLRQKKRPVSLSILPPVPSTPIALVTEEPVTARPTNATIPTRQRAESRRLVPPPLHLRNSVFQRASGVEQLTSVASTPSQTLFVFPPSPNLTTRTPSTMTLTSNLPGVIPFPSLSTPRVSTFQSKGRTRSFIGLGAPPTPTIAFSKVDARGYVGFG